MYGRQIEPALEALARLPEALGAPETLLADSGSRNPVSRSTGRKLLMTASITRGQIN